MSSNCFSRVGVWNYKKNLTEMEGGGRGEGEKKDCKRRRKESQIKRVEKRREK